MWEAIASIIKVLLEVFIAEMSKPHTAERAEYAEEDRYIDDAIERAVRSQGL